MGEEDARASVENVRWKLVLKDGAVSPRPWRRRMVCVWGEVGGMVVGRGKEVGIYTKWKRFGIHERGGVRFIGMRKDMVHSTRQMVGGRVLGQGLMRPTLEPGDA